MTKLGRARWRQRGFYDMEGMLTDGWLLVHRTLPRWSGPDGVIKPRDARQAAEMIGAFRRTGANGAFILGLGVEVDIVRGGLERAGLSYNERPDVQWEDAREPGRGVFFGFEFMGSPLADEETRTDR